MGRPRAFGGYPRRDVTIKGDSPRYIFETHLPALAMDYDEPLVRRSGSRRMPVPAGTFNRPQGSIERYIGVTTGRRKKLLVVMAQRLSGQLRGLRDAPRRFAFCPRRGIRRSSLTTRDQGGIRCPLCTGGEHRLSLGV